VGLSQYGARGRALEGRKAAEILAHYYKDTALGTMESGKKIRVLVLTGFTPSATRPFRIIGRDGPWAITGRKSGLPADAVLEMAKVPTAPGATTTTWQTTVRSAAGAILYRVKGLTDLTVAPSSPETRLQLWSKPTTYDRYRGTLRITAYSTSLSVVNRLGGNAYLSGVVPNEMPAGWPTEALRAQAIAARTYAVRRIKTTGIFDVFDDTRSQVYRGSLCEATTTTKAVSATGGRIVTVNGAIADGFFHSTAGGWTEDNEKAWVSSTGAKVAGAVSYLRGVSDRRPDGSSYDEASPYATWKTASYGRAALSAIFAHDSRTAVGTLSALDLSNRGVSKRLIAVTLVGSAGSKTVSGEVFRAVFNAWKPATDAQMRSTLLDLAPIP
jgi:SpoIID/LytB domain protein